MNTQRQDKLAFESINGKKVFCLFSAPEGAARRLVIMCHGFKGISTGPARAFVDFSSLLVQHGYSTLRFDQPNSGNSDGPFLESSFSEWVDTIVMLAEKYQKKGYEVTLLGQSMGATAVTVASRRVRLNEGVAALLLWVPDPITTFDGDPAAIYEEGGQKYRGQFWQEAKEADFFSALEQFRGRVHLVYGDSDNFVDAELRERVQHVTRARGDEVLVLEGEGHSGWHEDAVRGVFAREIEMLNEWIS